MRKKVRSNALCALAVLSVAAAPAPLPRTPDGHPDLQGLWANDTVTMLERPRRFAGEGLHVVERFTRDSVTTIRYRVS